MGLHRTCKNLVPLVFLAGLSILLQKVNCSCGSDAECSIINVQSTTSEINVTGLAGGFSLQNITFLNNSLVKPAESFKNITLITGLISGTQYVIYYGNSSISCCNTTTTKPKVVKQLSANNVTSNSISLIWNKPDEYNSNYFYRVQSSTPDITVQNESATINNLAAGQTYTFTVFIRANNVTEGDGVSYTTCTNPLPPGPLNITNIGTKSISVSWEDPINMVNLTKSFNITYNSSISSWTVLSNTSNVTLQSLTSGTKYSITVVTVGACQHQSLPVSSEVTTKPNPVKQLRVNNATSNSISLIWDKPDEYNSNYFYRVQSSTPDIIVQNESATINNLTAGQTYTFTVFTRANNITEGDGVSYTTCTNPLPPGPLNITNIGTKNISVSWEDPINMENLTKSFNITYNSSISSWTVLSNTSNVTLQSLTSGTKYSITVVTVGACQHQSLPVSSEVTTKPNPVKQLRVNNVTSNSISLNWDKPDEYNSNYFYRVQSSTPDIIVQNESATINNLTAGQTYTFTVFTRANNVTEGDGVSYTTCTNPLPPGPLNITNIGTKSISVSWEDPINMVNLTKSFNITYNSSISSWTVLSNTSNVTLQSLTSGTKYSITVVTVGACQHQSLPVSSEVTTKPNPVKQLRVNNATSNSISLIWDKPDEYNSNYFYRVQSSTPDIIVQNESATINNLTAGQTYTFTVFTRANNITEGDGVSYTTCTNPLPPGPLNITNIGTKSISVSWEDPINMVNLTKSFNITYNSSISSWTVLSNTSNVTLQSLTSGTKYSITVVTVGACQHQSLPVSSEVTTKPNPVKQLRVNNATSNSISLIWDKPDEYNSNYFYRVQSSTPDIIVQNESATINNLTAGQTYTFTVFTRANNITEGDGVSYTTCTNPLPPGPLNITNIGTKSISVSWEDPINMVNLTKSFNITYNSSISSWTVLSNTSNVTLQSLTSGTKYSITVVTVGACQHQSLPVSSEVTTKPNPVKQLRVNNVTSNSISLTWDKPDEYNSNYFYRVQSSTPDIIVQNESATINNLTAGETYTFTVFTRANNVTEGDGVSYTTCTIPGQILSEQINVTNRNSTEFLEVKWLSPAGRVDSYNVTLNGDLQKSIKTNATQVNFTNLLPGSEYSISIEVVSGNCSQKSSPVTEATYPSKPGLLNFTNIGTNNIVMSWGDPINMTNVPKIFNISFSNSTSTWTVSSNTSYVTEQNLTSGTKYTITVVTVGARQYQSSPVSDSVTTKPKTVKQLQINNVTSDSVSLLWEKPDEYNSNYTYRVQTNTSEIYVKNESATIKNLIFGQPYTFSVYTRANNVTEGDGVSINTCTIPGQILPKNIALSNKNSRSFIEVKWTGPEAKVEYYRVSLLFPFNNTIQTKVTQVNFTDLLPGREYSISILAVSGNCSQTSDPVTEATYPTQPESLNSTNIGTSTISLSWNDPINMTDVTKTFNISYSSSLGNWSIQSNISNVTLQNLRSGTKYTISVVTIGARQYQSSPVSIDVTTKPKTVKQLQISNVTSDSVSLLWEKPDEYNSNYIYRVQTNTSEIYVKNESATIKNLIYGQPYTFSVYTRANNVTEGDGVSINTCTIPGQILPKNITLSNKNSNTFIEVKWTGPEAKVDYYLVLLNGKNNANLQTNATQVNFTDLLPGKEYSISIMAVSGNCTQISSPVTEATYPSKPGSLNVSNIETNSISLFWEEPINMTGVAKSFNISYSTSSSILTVASNISNVTLPSLISGTTYTITVVTVGALQYQSLPVSIFVTTKPKPVKNLRTNNLTSESISVIWEKPDEYNSNYTYRVQINNSTSIIVITESTTITNLSSGQLYSISVFTRAYNLTEGESVSITTCIIPGQITSESINVTNKNSSNFLEIKWPLPKANVDYYNVLLNGDPSKTTKINNMNTTQVNFTDLLPGREYSISIQTVSGNCTQTAGPVTEATYPSPPGTLNFTKTETQNITLSWGDPINMANVTKSFNIMYSNSTVTWTITSNTSSVTLQSLISGTNYAVTVVTVGARKYQSSPVSGNVTTIPESVHLLQCSSVYEKPELSLTWQCPNGSHSIFEITLANGTSVINKNVTSNCISGKQTEILTYLKYFTKYSVNITTLSFDKRSNVVQITSCQTSIARPPEINVSPVQSVKPSNDKIDFTFAQFDSSNGPIMAYAVVVSAQTNDAKPPQGILNYTYNDFKNKKSTIYVTYIKESGFRSGISNKANPITVQIGDGSKTHGYSNGPLEASTSYWISIAGFSRIQYDNNTGTIIENSSLATFAPYSKVTTSNAGAIAGSIMGYMLGIFALMMLI